ncbi:MAG: tRNA uridine-5-carboxymethylaminomethyl(34) synthesis GTPase MnmE [Alphaproteobacteria bacterium]|nr:tRNA uridine-5-carboxymethylaminomethyl(34) synthesis GTPase MnmE [Alphaproteobacteria bacterium]
MTERDTIFALASGPGTAGVAVIRISGPAAGPALERLIRRPLPKPRVATHARLFAPEEEGDAPGGLPVDDGLVLWFPAPRSFTGEDVAELHVHGGRATLDAVGRALAAAGPLRPAEAGEFTRRAFENGKMDLTQAEALADLVAAETDAQRRQAMGQLMGALGAIYEGWRERLIALTAEIEATIDFADEELPEGLLEGAFPALDRLREEIAGHLADAHRGERLRAGLSAVILGPPNVGKSSLINYLSGREAAIVAASAGTTRDVIEVHLDLGGMPVTVADTAGPREAAEAVEEEGVRRALARAEGADLKIVVFDARDWPALDSATEALIDENALILLNKSDLHDPCPDGVSLTHIDDHGKQHTIYSVSVRTGAGLGAVLTALEEMARARLGPGMSAPLTRARHRAALEETVAALGRIDRAEAVELNAEELRIAARALGRITGRVDVEDILDRIFAEFCIGK